MLRRVSVENYLSIGEKIEFNMFSGTYKIHKKNRLIETNHDSLLKITSLWGPNGSGKSNFIKAIAFLQSLVVKGSKDIKDKINPIKNKLGENWFHKPTKFEIDFYYNDILYLYKIAINNNIIEEESLYTLTKDITNRIFSRITNNKGVSKLKFAKSKQTQTKEDLRRQIYQEELRQNQPFITEGFNKKMEFISLAYLWFDEKLIIVTPGSFFPGMVQNFVHDKSFKKLLNNIIQSIDVGINEIDVETSDIDSFFGKDSEDTKNKILKNLDKNHGIVFSDDEGNEFSAYINKKNTPEVGKLVFKHKSNFNEIIKFDLTEESDGTKRYIELIPASIFASKNDQVFIIDELDRSLHPHLVEQFILSYINLLNESSKGQLIFTTHCEYIMTLKLFRQDEIWFMDREDGSSKLYPLSDFPVRHDKDIRKAYKHGIFGAIPALTEHVLEL